MSSSLFYQLLKDPRATGALLPSSPTLARELARLAIGADRVLELGAGTGAVTQELYGVTRPENLDIVELQRDLAKNLGRRYPDVPVHHKPAHVAVDGYPHRGSKAAIALVSSLPFRSLSPSIKRLTMHSILDFLNDCPRSRLIQFTYGLGHPFDAPGAYRWERVKWVMTNLPPACIWTLTKTA